MKYFFMFAAYGAIASALYLIKVGTIAATAEHGLIAALLVLALFMIGKCLDYEERLNKLEQKIKP